MIILISRRIVGQNPHGFSRLVILINFKQKTCIGANISKYYGQIMSFGKTQFEALSKCIQEMTAMNEKT